MSLLKLIGNVSETFGIPIVTLPPYLISLIRAPKEKEISRHAEKEPCAQSARIACYEHSCLHPPIIAIASIAGRSGSAGRVEGERE